MDDLIFIAAGAALYVATLALVFAFDRLRGPR